jgi:hypothetical protein
LSILLHQDGFSFLITNASTHKISKLVVYELPQSGNHPVDSGGWPVNESQYIKELNDIEIVKNSYNKVYVAIASHKYSLAPGKYLERSYVQDMLGTAHSTFLNETFLTESVFASGPSIAAAIPLYISENLLNILPSAHIHVAPAILIKGILRQYSHDVNRQIFLNIGKRFLEIAIIQGSRLLYLNSFRFSTASDVLYYLIFVLEQLGFVPSEENVTLFGDISENGIIFSQLKMYCASLTFASLPDNDLEGQNLSEIQWHKHFTILNLPICG